MRKTTNREIGIRLKESRSNKGYTLQQVAQFVGVDRSTIQRYEVGGIVVIKRPVVESICACLGVNPAWVLGESEDKYPLEGKEYFPEDVLFAARRLSDVPEEKRKDILERLMQELDELE